MASIKRLVARRLSLPLPGHLELCLLLPPADDDDDAGPVVVVLDDALTLRDVVAEVWGPGADVSKEMVLYYLLRGPGDKGVVGGGGMT